MTKVNKIRASIYGNLVFLGVWGSGTNPNIYFKILKMDNSLIYAKAHRLKGL